MSKVTNIVLLFNDWLEEGEVIDILELLKPLENQKLNPGRNAFIHIDNKKVGISRNLECTVLIGALHRVDSSEFEKIMSIIKNKYDIQIMMNDENDWIGI